MSIKRAILNAISITAHVRWLMALSHGLGNKVPVIGLLLSILVDRLILWFYALDVSSRNVFVADLRIPHPAGVLLGGNGIRSSGRVLVNAGVKFVGKWPNDPEYLRLHREKAVFRLGHDVVIGANAVIIGPVSLCDNVVIGAMSVVSKDIVEPGIYVGNPARKIKDGNAADWFA